MSSYREFEQAARRSDISMAQYRLMLYLQNGPKRAGEIAAAAEIAKPTVSLAINGLREKGWVTTSPDTDGRASCVVITPSGRKRMKSFEGELGALLKKMMGEGDFEALTEVLADAYHAMGATKDERLKSVEREMKD